MMQPDKVLNVFALDNKANIVTEMIRKNKFLPLILTNWKHKIALEKKGN